MVLPTPIIAVCVEGLKVVNGQLVHIPVAQKGSLGKLKRSGGSLAPASLHSFTWPADLWDMAGG